MPIEAETVPEEQVTEEDALTGGGPGADEDAGASEFPAEFPAEGQVDDPYDFDEPPDDEPVEGEEPSETGDEEVPSEAEEPEIEPALLARAESVGFSPEYAQTLGKAGLLDSALVEEDRRLAAAMRGQREAPAEGAEGAAAPADAAEAAEAEAAEAFKLEMDPEAYDPGLVSAISGLNDHYAERVGRLERNLEELMGLTAERLEDERTSRYDQMFGELEADHAERFGEGPLRSLQPESVHKQNRDTLVNAMEDLRTINAQRGRALSEQELRDRALRMEFGDVLKTQARKEVEANVTKRSGAVVARATRRTPTALETGDERAKRGVGEWYKRKGISEFGDDEEEELEDGLP